MTSGPREHPAFTGGRLAELAALADRNPAVARRLPSPGGWAIAPEVARLLAGLVLDLRLADVLEFGAGSSSRVLAAALAERGGRLTSVEQDPGWCAGAWREVERTAGVDARLVQAAPRLTLERRGVFFRFADAAPALAQRGPFDLVLIDAPQFFYGRDGSLHLAWAHLAPGALIVLDDAGRSGERRTVRRWLRTYPGLRLLHFDPALGSNGVALLRSSGDRAVRTDLRSALGSGVSALDGWRRRRRRAARARAARESRPGAAPPGNG